MATKYADFDLATGNNDGSDWTNAWKTMSDAIAGTNSAPPAAGDTVYCRGTDTIAGGLTNALAGDVATGMIKWIGVNASGTNDGTRATIDGNGGGFVVFTQNGNYNFFENFRFTGSSNNYGFSGTGDFIVWVNCSFDTNGTVGLQCYWNASCLAIRCVAYGNGTVGIQTSAGTKLIFCCIRDNTGDGLYYNINQAIGCIVYDNGDKGYEDFHSGVLFNCVFDSNVSKGIEILGTSTELQAIIGCRVTNQSGAGDIGFDANGDLCFYGWNAFDGNTDHIANSTLAIPITNNGAATNSELNENGAGGGDTNQGYVLLTEGSEDYSTNYVSGTDPHLRRTAITIPTS